MKKMQKARAEALEAAVGALSRGILSSGAKSVDVKSDELIAYAKFVLGKPALLRRRTKVQGGERRAYWAPAGEPLPNPWETSSPVGEDPGDREVLTQWAETIRQQAAAREAAREAATLEASTNAPDHVVRQGASLGCPECTAELTARWEKEAKNKEVKKEEGGRKLAERLDATTGRSGDLDEDELLAVAGSELYPANDEEPSREAKIRNRKGEVRSFRSVAGATGWTLAPGDPWSLHLVWTSSEMVRRGPWHVV